MSDAVVGSKDLLTDAESLQQSIDQAAAEPSNVRMPAPRRAHSMGPYYAGLAAAIVAPAILFGIVAWQTRVYMLRNATAEVARTVELAAHQARDLLQMDQLLAERVNEYTRGMTWDEIQHSEALHLYLKGLTAEYPQAGVLFLADGSGIGRASNLVFPQPAVSAADRDYFQALQGGNASVSLGAMSRAELAARSTSTSRYAVLGKRLPSMASSWRAHARVFSQTSGRRWCRARVHYLACMAMTAECLPVCRQPTWPTRPSIRTDR
jgi:hypothetical protein